MYADGDPDQPATRPPASAPGNEPADRREDPPVGDHQDPPVDWTPPVDWLGADQQSRTGMSRRTTLIVAILGLIAALVAVLLCCQVAGLLLSGLSSEVCDSQLCPPTTG